MRQLLRHRVTLPEEPSANTQGFGMEIPYPGAVLLRHDGCGQ